jgi:hypothetical protein
MWRIWSGGPLKRSTRNPPLRGVPIHPGQRSQPGDQQQPGHSDRAARGLGGLNIRSGARLPGLEAAMACCQSPFVTICISRAKGPAPNHSTYVVFGSQGNRR